MTIDPNLFHIDWERTLEALVGIVILSFFVERACALLFESRWWIGRFEDARVAKPSPGEGAGGPAGMAAEKEKPPEAEKEAAKEAEPSTGAATASAVPDLLPGRRYPLKEALGFLLALVICWTWDFDAVSIILLSEQTKLFGVIVTALIIAGGSKASIRLFHNILNIRSSASAERKTLKERDATT